MNNKKQHSFKKRKKAGTKRLAIVAQTDLGIRKFDLMAYGAQDAEVPRDWKGCRLNCVQPTAEFETSRSMHPKVFIRMTIVSTEHLHVCTKHILH